MEITSSPSGNYGYYAAVTSEQDTTDTIGQILESFPWQSENNNIEILVKFFPEELYVQKVWLYIEGAAAVQIDPYSNSFAYDEVSKYMGGSRWGNRGSRWGNRGSAHPENLSLGINEQQRCTPVCASAQSDQSLCYIKTCYKQNFTIPVCLYS